MSGTYTVVGTSRDSAAVEDDIPLPSTDPNADKVTRRIARAQIVRNVHDPRQSVRVSLIHQRRSPKAAAWEDSPAFLATLKAGEEVRLHLDASQTWHLYRALEELYAIGPENIPAGEKRLLVLDAGSARILEGTAEKVVAYFEQHGPQLWEVIDQMKPDLLDVAALHKVYEARRREVAEFRARMASGDWTEPDWQRFFETNTWLFGHSLAYRFLSPVQPQPTYGGVTFTGSGAQRGDMLMSSVAAVRFTVLVEIKRPDTALLDPREYRNKVYRPSDELGGGVAQVQQNCRTWIVEGSRQEDNLEALAREGVHTYEPKGIQLIGDCAHLDTTPKRASFELFRRNLHNPEVITYDELLARAEFLVSMTPESLAGLGPA